MALLRTHDVARVVGVHRDTLLRWLREGRIPEPQRDRNGWRLFDDDQARTIIEYAKATAEGNTPVVREVQPTYEAFSEQLRHLKKLDWDFVTADTEYLNHSIHPYPCKFIPQIPNTLIQELSSVGETVLDNFCGSGTTLVEAMRLNRNAIGIDANPVAALISEVKSVRITDLQVSQLQQLAAICLNKGENFGIATLPLFPEQQAQLALEPSEDAMDWIRQWYDDHVIREIADIKRQCNLISDGTTKKIALVALSAILVNVSKQDSDTRYVKRNKNLPPGETFLRFSRSLNSVVNQLLAFRAETNPKTKVEVLNRDILSAPEIPKVHLVVCSPPYPNAYSYHLYHRSRMLWLDMDPEDFKKREIGSHRKYSSKGKNAATKETFAGELHTILNWLALYLEKGRHACFVVGNSLINGQVVSNENLLIQVAKECGYRLDASIVRKLLETKKYFNPKIGKIREEHIVILRNCQ